MLTSPSGLLFYGLFPIAEQLRFPNFLQMNLSEKSASKPIIRKMKQGLFFLSHRNLDENFLPRNEIYVQIMLYIESNLDKAKQERLF